MITDAGPDRQQAPPPVAVLGGSGRVGGRVVDLLARRGHRVTALSRTPPAGLADGVEGVGVDARDPAALATALRGAALVVSALSGPVAAATRSLVPAMGQAGLRRCVVVGTAGVLPLDGGRLRRDAPDYPARFRPISAEHLAAHGVLASSDLDWTMVCPPSIVDGEATGRYRVADERHPGPTMVIPVGDLAAFIVRELLAGDHLRRRVGIAADTDGGPHQE